MKNRQSANKRQYIFMSVFVYVSGILSNLIATWIEPRKFWVSLIILICIGLGVVLLLYRVFRGSFPVIVMNLKRKKLKQENLLKSHRHEVLICSPSLYRYDIFREKKEDDNNVMLERALKHAKMKNYSAFEFERSNLQPVANAILAQGDSLTDCWFICTSEQKDDAGELVKPGSITFMPIFEEYLKTELSINANIHYEKEQLVHIDNDDQVIDDSKEIADNIIQQYQRESRNSIVIDCSSAIRTIMLGLLQTAIENNIALELIGTKRDQSGDPIDDNYPILLEFNPTLRE